MYFQESGACISNDSVSTDSIASQNAIAEKSTYADVYIAQIKTGGTVDSLDGGCTITATFKDSGLNNALQGNSLIYTLYSFATSTPKWACHTPDIQVLHYILLPKNCRHSTFIEAKV
jgi:type IV pilus assembly protein PilA